MSFAASYTGRCGNCTDLFEPGDEVAYDNDGVLVIVECCGAADESRTQLATVEVDRVMPRGKTAADKCRICFQIPSSNDVCGCS
jgi:hypothetical protein